jgi:hypothetical protein
MMDQRQGVSLSARMRLLAGVAGLMLAASGAHAQQSLATVPPVPVVKAPPSDGLGTDGYYLESDVLIRDDKSHTMTAQGDVEARYQGRTLRAQEVIYDTEAGIVHAKGKVQLINADGTAQFADEMTLDKDLKAGFALGFAARMDKNVKIAAASAIKRNETITELNQAIYTPCEVCAEKPTPTWSLAADRVVQDKQRQLVYYKNVVIRLWGAPLMYLPVFWHPDPQAARSSGFLTPKLGASKRRGMSYQQPYLYVISPSQDVVVSPQINSSVNPFLNVNWRKRFYSGYAEARMGYTYEKNIDSRGERFGEATSRSYILAKGLFDINDKWKWGFSAERASDKLLFDNYSINDVYQSRGLFTSEDRRLNSQIYTTRQDKQSYFSLSAISVQGLRVSGIDPSPAWPVREQRRLPADRPAGRRPLATRSARAGRPSARPGIGRRPDPSGVALQLHRQRRRQPARQHQRRLALEHHPEVGHADLAVRPGAGRRLSHHRPARDRQHTRLFASPGRDRRRSELSAAQAPEERQHRARAPGPGRGRFGQPARADRGRNLRRHEPISTTRTAPRSSSTRPTCSAPTSRRASTSMRAASA